MTESFTPTYTIEVTERPADKAPGFCRKLRRTLDSRKIADPFIRTTIRPKGIVAAIAALFGWLEYQVWVDGDRTTIEKVMCLDDDYLGEPGSPRRTAWNDQVNAALGKL